MAIEFASTIEDFDKLVDPRTLARHCLGPEPSHYILRAIRKEKKSKLIWGNFVYKSFPFVLSDKDFYFILAEMMTKFN